ncbi:hypothetical protein [Nocardia farcinica]|uniref:hypothetical protein n=1 Tax=Nocardia farcinica TaxID=37329 RepID=UPI002458141E|nr:hypothetical protein [Nocardia farcinica]
MMSSDYDEAVRRFFAPPNLIWPNLDPDVGQAGVISPFIHSARDRGECPLVLPRRDGRGEAATVYVVCWDTAHAGRIRPVLHAFFGAYLSPFDGRVARLRMSDVPERAIHDLVGPGTTFVLRPDPETESHLVRGLQRLVRSLAGRPRRRPSLPRPVGRLLREFDVALAAGAIAQSTGLLEEIERIGGISHENLAFLQLQRLGRLGRDSELLAHTSLPTVVHTEPPTVVREAILGAWSRVNLYTDGELDVQEALGRLRNDPVDVAMLAGAFLARSHVTDAVALGVIVAAARGDRELALLLLKNQSIGEYARSVLEKQLGLHEQPESTSDNAPPVEAGQVSGESDQEPVEDTDRSPGSWIEWLGGLDGTAPSHNPMELADSWPPVAEHDAEIAHLIDALPDIATEALLAGVAAFLETSDSEVPAPETAHAFIRRYLIEERFAPADVSALTALLAIVLSSAPKADDYAELLDDLGAFTNRWVSVNTAAQALDLADVVTCGPRPDSDTQIAFVTRILGELHHKRHRLAGALRSLAALISDDLSLDFDWTSAKVEGASAERELPTGLRVLLYSLDAGTLDRVEAALTAQYPTIQVSRSSDKVGNAALRQHSRNADVIAIATRRAAHAATGFIVDNAVRGRICYPDGSGSASMLRAVEAELDDLRTSG